MSWGWSLCLVVVSLCATACFDPDAGRLDSGPVASTTTDPGTTPETNATTGSSATSTTSSSMDGTSGGSSADGTTLGLDGTSTGPGPTSDATTGTTMSEGSSSEESSGGGSSSTGPMMGCVPGPEMVEFESLGGFVGQGDAWQSFTAGSDGDVVRIDFYWNLSGTNDSFTINLYEGEGTGGMLLHSQVFPGQGMGVFVGFDGANVLGTPVPITAGSVYTVQGVDTFGWQTASGAIMGSTSSLGAGQHKNIRVWIEPCV